MGREVRMVPQGWEHPKDTRGTYMPLLKGPWAERVAEWDLRAAKFAEGLVEDLSTDGAWIDKKSAGCDSDTYEDYAGGRPREEDYMPVFPPGEATWLMMYETTSEGTPISPSFATPEELARWLADNGASAFAGMTVSYEDWLRVAKGGYAPSAVIQGGRLRSGVEL